jgi:Cof subfamily protein (haloacid dehalogenase superfamily)
MIKLIAADMDGTLLDSGQAVSAENRAAIRRAASSGIHFAFCTGRTSPGVLPYAKEIFEGMEEEYFLILGGGASLSSSQNDKTLMEQTIDYPQYLMLRKYTAEYDVQLVAYTDSRVYTANPDITVNLINECHIVRMPVYFCDEGYMRDIARFVKLQFVGSPAPINRVFERLEGSGNEGFSANHTTPFCIEITSPEATKGKALEFLTRHLELDPAEIMAAGDQSNDMSMIKYAGFGVAMGNAAESLKAAARAVVADNNHHGVAEAINRFVLAGLPWR